jgi:hypothetical protein
MIIYGVDEWIDEAMDYAGYETLKLIRIVVCKDI